MKKLYYHFSIIALSAIILMGYISCQNELHEKEVTVDETVILADNYLDIIKSMGFDITGAIEFEDFYIVEGSIRLYKENLLEHQKQTTRQASYTYIVSDNTRYNIRVQLDSEVTIAWRSAIEQAINNWNSFNGLHFVIVDTAPYDITIGVDLVGGGYANTNWPTSNGKPGRYIILNKNAQLTPSQQIALVAHEIGTSLGFRNTNWSGQGEASGIGIAGTPNTGNNPDPNSMMNAYTSPRNWNGFSSYDQIAINTLYPPISIIGPDRLCYNTDATYSIANLPANATVNWSTTGELNPPQSSNQTFMVRFIGYGSGATITATITLPSGSTKTTNKTIQNPSGGRVEVKGGNFGFGYGQTQCYLDGSGPRGELYEWSCSHGTVTQGEPYAIIDYYIPVGFQDEVIVGCSYIDACGFEQYAYARYGIR